MKREITAIFDKDSKNCHRFLIKLKKGISGSIYVVKGKQIPESVRIYLKTSREIEEEKGRGVERRDG